MMARTAHRTAPGLLAAALLVGTVLFGSAACFDDECTPACRAGYACYYGICLSRGYCPLDDPFAEETPHCVERDESGDCTDFRGLCREGYSCECSFVGGDGACRDRRCVPAESVVE